MEKLFVSIPIALTHAGIHYHFYLIDILLIVVLFCGLTFMIGYFGKEQLNLRKIELPDTPNALIAARSNMSNVSVGSPLVKSQRERVS